MMSHESSARLRIFVYFIAAYAVQALMSFR